MKRTPLHLFRKTLQCLFCCSYDNSSQSKRTRLRISNIDIVTNFLILKKNIAWIGCRYLHAEGHDREVVQKFLIKHRTEGVQESTEITDLNIEFNPQTISDQVNFIGSLSNDFNVGTSNFSGDRYFSAKMPSNRLPLSIRNRLVHYHQERNIQMFEQSFGELATGQASFLAQNASRQKRRRTHKPYELENQETVDGIDDNDDYVVPDITSMDDPNLESAFERYSFELLETGKFIWRSTSPTLDSFVMNGYENKIQPSSYENVSVAHMPDGKQYWCSCRAYHNSKSEALINPEKTPTCCHCRFIQDYVIPNYQEVTGDTDIRTRMEKFIQSAYFEPKPDILFLTGGNVRTVKFSVRASADDELPSFVHYTDSHLTCSSDTCNVRMGFHRRRKPRSLIELDKFVNLCPHLQTMKRNVEAWLGYIIEQRDENEVCFFYYTVKPLFREHLRDRQKCSLFGGVPPRGGQ